MNLRLALALALKTIRKRRKLTQEDFGLVSSRTYISALERGLKSPTIDKLDEIARQMGIHPASLVLVTYAILAGQESAQATFDQILSESSELIRELSEVDQAAVD